MGTQQLCPKHSEFKVKSAEDVGSETNRATSYLLVRAV